jgi:uncharacterized coiled-coil protein SlyX
MFLEGMKMQEILKEILSQMQVMSVNIEKSFNEIENKQDETNHRLTKMETRLTKMETRFTKLETTIENKTNVKIQALFEDRDVVHCKLDNITNELADLKEEIVDHGIKIQVINNKTKAI